ncbi:hypothetical protein C8R43DRAFT_982584 [Mycena crocata]|nr:hypothetical protein C8R43DRAFT_982584 [Mycena crocata]
MDSLVRLLLILVTAIFYDRQMVPPNIASPQEQKRTLADSQENVGWYERFALPILPVCIRIVSWSFAITEAIAILSSRVPTGTESSSKPSPVEFTPTFLIGTALVISGSAIRLLCFRELGRHFTFQLSLRDGHRLITTGPYGIVRHPSYTGANMAQCGLLLVHLCGGSWWSSVGHATWWGNILAANCIVCVLALTPPFRRGGAEDAFLKSKFGVEWEQFAKRVPRRYIPGVY